MIRTFTVLAALLLAVTASDAAIYRWTDEQGTVHFAEDPGLAPEKLRAKVVKVDDAEPASGEKVLPQEVTAAPVPPQAVFPGGSVDDLYAGRTRGEWQKELADREAAMAKIRGRIDEIAVMIKDYRGEWEEQKKLLLEYNAKSKQLKEMRADYFSQVEAARKAGLMVNIQE